MIKTLVHPELPITLIELREAKKAGSVLTVKIIETTYGFYVHLDKKGRPNTSCYLSTRRDINKPRLFRDLVRLNKLLRGIFPTGVIELVCFESCDERKITKKKSKNSKNSKNSKKK